jgi:LuxR family maltose regulon positive regulatory protein
MGPLQYSWVRAFGDINPVLLEIDLCLAEGRGRDAAVRAQEMVDQSRQRQRISELTSFLLRLAIARRMEGDDSRAYQALREAVHTGLAGGFVRSMVVPGYHLPTYFGEMWQSVRHSPEARARFQDLPFETDDVQAAPFTPRETEVLNLVASGMSNKQIATTLFISVNTVRNHLVRMSKRLQTRSRTELVAKARTIGVLD